MIPHRSLRRFATAFGPLLALAVAACSDAVRPVSFDEPVDLILEWRTASPEATGMDAGQLDLAALHAENNPRVRSLVVIRRGRLAFERYFQGTRATDLADVRSVTKSVVGTLTGIAIERGDIAGLDQSIGELLPDDVAELDPWEKDIAVGDLLTMTGGWEWHEAGSVGYNEWITSPDPLRYLLDKPEAAAPGTTFEYNSAAAHLLGVVVERATGGSLPAFADRELFQPLGIALRAWEPMPDGHVNGGAGLDLTPRDLARIGQLYLQDGMSGRTRVLPAGWVAEATRRRFAWTTDAGPTRASYGYLWWIDVDNDAYFAWGYGGQFIYVAPTRDLVVVLTTEWRGADGLPPPSSAQALSIIVDDVLPAAPIEH